MVGDQYSGAGFARKAQLEAGLTEAGRQAEQEVMLGRQRVLMVVEDKPVVTEEVADDIAAEMGADCTGHPAVEVAAAEEGSYMELMVLPSGSSRSMSVVEVASRAVEVVVVHKSQLTHCQSSSPLLHLVHYSSVAEAEQVALKGIRWVADDERWLVMACRSPDKQDCADYRLY